MGHLHTVAAQSEKNLMPILNLAPLWGPNITTVDEQEGKGGHVYGQTSGEMESFHAVSQIFSFKSLKKLLEIHRFRLAESALLCALTSSPTIQLSSMWTGRR